MGKIKEKGDTKPLYKIVLILIALLVVILSLIAIFTSQYYQVNINKDVVVTVGKEKITTSELNKAILSSPFLDAGKGIEDISTGDKKSVLDRLIEEKIVFAYSNDNNIKIQPEKLLAEAIRINKGYNNLPQEKKEELDKNSKFNLVRSIIQEREISWVSGDFVGIRFDRNFAVNLAGTKEQQNADKEYAKNLRDKLYQKVLNKEITFAEAQNQVQEDKNIDISTYPGTWGNQYGSFGKNDWLEIFNETDNQTKLANLQSGDINKDLVGNIMSQNTQIADIPGVYYIVKIKDVFKGSANSYNQWLSDQRDKTVKTIADAFITRAYAGSQNYWPTPVNATYYSSADGKEYAINGIKFTFTTTGPDECNGGPKATYWQRDSAGVVTSSMTLRELIGGDCNKELVAAGRTNFQMSCSMNPFRFHYEFLSGASDTIKKGRLYAERIDDTETGININTSYLPVAPYSTPATGDLVEGTDIAIHNDEIGQFDFHWTDQLPCTVSASIEPSSAFAKSYTPIVKTTVSQATSANLTFDGTGSIAIPTNGSKDTPHTYSVLGAHGATASCTGADGVLRTNTATFVLFDKAKPCPLLCSTVQKSLVAGTATTPSPNSAYDYQTLLNDAGTKDKDVEVKLTATVTDATTALWNYLERSGITVSSSNLAVKELVHMTSALNGFTPWSNPIGGTTAKSISFTKYGKYKINLEGINPGQLDDSKYLTCDICPIAVNINRPICKADDIVSNPARPVKTSPANPDGNFIASNTQPISITFSSKTSKILPDGVQTWKLEQYIGSNWTVVTKNNLAVTATSPQISYTFGGTTDITTVPTKPRYGPGVYKLTLLASSMVGNAGGVDPDGECSKTFEFTVERGAECKCTIGPAQTGVAPQKVTVSVVGDSSLYDNSFQLIVNNKKLTPTTLKPGSDIFSGDITSLLKGVGKYYIAIEAKRSATTPTSFPNIVPCEDPTDTLPRYCGSTGLCNYTVTNPDGGGVPSEVAL
ncbi:MAG: SurA N-terminal domain-containing protein [bacterium]